MNSLFFVLIILTFIHGDIKYRMIDKRNGNRMRLFLNTNIRVLSC
jgi:hypothetical protein